MVRVQLIIAKNSPFVSKLRDLRNVHGMMIFRRPLGVFHFKCFGHDYHPSLIS